MLTHQDDMEIIQDIIRVYKFSNKEKKIKYETKTLFGRSY